MMRFITAPKKNILAERETTVKLDITGCIKLIGDVYTGLVEVVKIRSS